MPSSGPDRFRWSSASSEMTGRRQTRATRTWQGMWSPMDIDLSVLRSLESEKDISMELAIKAIEDALLVAYHKTEGAAPTARVEVDRQSGHVTVWASNTADPGEDGEVTGAGEVAGDYDDTPEGFGRIAATTARQVILQ